MEVEHFAQVYTYNSCWNQGLNSLPDLKAMFLIFLTLFFHGFLFFHMERKRTSLISLLCDSCSDISREHSCVHVPLPTCHLFSYHSLQILSNVPPKTHSLDPLLSWSPQRALLYVDDAPQMESENYHSIPEVVHC